MMKLGTANSGDGRPKKSPLSSKVTPRQRVPIRQMSSCYAGSLWSGMSGRQFTTGGIGRVAGQQGADLVGVGRQVEGDDQHNGD